MLQQSFCAWCSFPTSLCSFSLPPFFWPFNRLHLQLSLLPPHRSCRLSLIVHLQFFQLKHIVGSFKDDLDHHPKKLTAAGTLTSSLILFQSFSTGIVSYYMYVQVGIQTFCIPFTIVCSLFFYVDFREIEVCLLPRKCFISQGPSLIFLSQLSTLQLDYDFPL